MRMLIVAATAREIAPLVDRFSGQYVESGPQYVESGFSRIRDVESGFSRIRGPYSCGPHTLDVLVTGVGMVATAVHCARALAREPYALAINLGICGSFDRALSPESVVHITSERFPELGAEDGDRFLPAHEIGLLDDALFEDGVLLNRQPPHNRVLAGLAPVRGITVNTVHGNDRTIAEVVRRLDPQVESMEGAAFFYACLTQGVPFAQVRSVSNMVERRNRAAWKIGEAIERLCETAHAIIEAA